MSIKRNDAIPALTGFRWLAASLVFLYHNRKYWRDQLPDLLDKLLNEFHIGVSLFFILSGYLITKSYGIKPAESPKSYVKYLLQRVTRIYPMYWLILGAYALDPLFGDVQNGILLFTLAHGMSDQVNLQGISQAWSLTVEMSYYLIAPFLTLAYNKNLKIGLLSTMLVSALFVVTGFAWKAINGNPRSFFHPLLFLVNGTLAGQLLLFIAGGSIGMIWKVKNLQGLSSCKHKTAIGSIGVLLTLILSICFQQNAYDQANLHISGSVFQIISIALFGMLWIQGLIEEETIQSKFFSTRLMILLGNASFIFYLIHISYVNLRIKMWILLPDRNYILLWGLSCLLYLLIERPLYLAAKKLIAKI